MIVLPPEKNLRGLLPGLLIVLGALLSCGRDAGEQPPATPMVLVQPCDIGLGCVAAAEGLSVEVLMGPEVRALTPFPVQIEIAGGQSIASVTVAFGMKDMDMGLNRYGLVQDETGVWHGSVTLPVCMSGRSDWIADFELLAGKNRYRFELPFVLAK